MLFVAWRTSSSGQTFDDIVSSKFVGIPRTFLPEEGIFMKIASKGISSAGLVYTFRPHIQQQKSFTIKAAIDIMLFLAIKSFLNKKFSLEKQIIDFSEILLPIL